ncbi:MAG: LytR/AlgR family response regulator transcription factor, partial [Longimicrobiales bacterium]
AVVFITSYDQYLLSALHVGAVDYLINPFGKDRFDNAAARLAKRMFADGPSAAERIRAGLLRHLERVFVQHRGTLMPVRIDDVIHIEAADDYARMHVAGAAYLTRLTLAELEQRLDSRFIRIHRSHIVNLTCVDYIEPSADRRCVVHLRGGTRLLTSRAGAQRIRALRI